MDDQQSISKHARLYHCSIFTRILTASLITKYETQPNNFLLLMSRTLPHGCQPLRRAVHRRGDQFHLVDHGENGNQIRSIAEILMSFSMYTYIGQRHVVISCKIFNFTSISCPNALIFGRRQEKRHGDDRKVNLNYK